MNQFETEKLRRTNMLMSLNHNVMNKTLAPSDSLVKGGSHSLKKLPTQMSSSKKSPHRDEEEDDHTPVFKANYSQGGPTPVK